MHSTPLFTGRNVGSICPRHGRVFPNNASFGLVREDRAVQEYRDANSGPLQTERLDYGRWERSRSMELWQMDIVGGVNWPRFRGEDRIGTPCANRLRLGPRVWSGLGVLAGVDEGFGDFAEFDVHVLGGATEYVECLVGGDSFAFDQDALCLADEFAGAERFDEVRGLPVVGFFAFGRIEGEACEGGEELSLGAVSGSERMREATVEVERTCAAR